VGREARLEKGGAQVVAKRAEELLLEEPDERVRPAHSGRRRTARRRRQRNAQRPALGGGPERVELAGGGLTPARRLEQLGALLGAEREVRRAQLRKPPAG